MLNIGSTVKKFPKLPYEKIKDDILGKRYELSLVFVGEKRAQDINITTRNKTYKPNVLSFPLSDIAGEIYISPKVAERQAKSYNHTYNEHVAFLFIHGCLHLKGLDHGDKMDKLEQKYLSKYQK